MCVSAARRWGWQDKREGTQVLKMLRKSTKFNTTEDIKYDIERKTVAEVASHNSLEKEGRKGLGETKVLMVSTPMHRI